MTTDDYHALSYYTLAHGDPAFIHQHIVDAHCAQTADATTKPIAIAFALIGLSLSVERKRTGREVQRVHMRLAQRRREWPRFPQPAQRGHITVSDVVAIPPGPDRDAMIARWCASVWDAWKDSHDRVKALLREAGI